MRKTKIIATLGPATDSPEMLRKLIETGVNVFRLNMSHAPHDWVKKVVSDIRDASEKTAIVVAILMDTQGPAIRTGDLPTKLNLNPGDIFTFTVRGQKSEELHSVDVNYDDLANDISVGDIVLVDNGVIRMKVLSKDDKHLRCEVLTPGLLGSRRHINLPGVKVNLPALTEKDIEDVHLGIALGVDYFALSFVREAKDVELLRTLLVSKGCEAKIIAKIEDQLAVRNIEEIIHAADAIMVARGDLGIECPYEELPIIQRRIVKTCLQKVKPVIVATHMLESMIGNPIPTRAEITDVANAIFEQADAIMLSGETTVGKYPLECIKVMHTVAERIERSGSSGFSDSAEISTDPERVAAAAVGLANSARVEGIGVFTRRGYLAATTAGLRPRSSIIYAFSPDPKLCRQLALLFGIIPIQLDFREDPNENVAAATTLLKQRGHLQTGQKVVFISDLQMYGQTLSSIQLTSIP